MTTAEPVHPMKPCTTTCKLAVFLTALLLTACGEAPPPGDRITVPMGEKPASLDPALGSTRQSQLVISNVYDTLYRYRYLAEPASLAPNLAAAMPTVSDDGLRYRIELKRGVRFSNDQAFPEGVGREVLADDVVYSIKRHFVPGTLSRGDWLWRSHLAGLEEWIARGADIDDELPGLRAVDSHVVEFTLRQAFSPFVSTLANHHSAVVPREAVEHYGPAFASRPVGSGPFRIASSDATRIVLERNPDFREEFLDLGFEGFDPKRHGALGLEPLDGRRIPLVDELAIEVIPDAMTAWRSYLKGGELDTVRVPSSLQASVFEGRADPATQDRLVGHRVVQAPTLGISYLTFNMDDPLVGRGADAEVAERNRALRCAITHSYDWQRRIETDFGGLGVVMKGMLHPLMPEFESLTSATREERLDRARRALEASGWASAGATPLYYGVHATTVERQNFELFRSGLIEIGVDGELIRMRSYPSFGAFAQAMAAREVPVMHLGWGLDYPDMENLLQLFYGPNASPGPNTANYANPEYDALFEVWRFARPGPERTRVFKQLNAMLLEDCVLIGAATGVSVFATSPDVLAHRANAFARPFAWRFYARSP